MGGQKPGQQLLLLGVRFLSMLRLHSSFEQFALAEAPHVLLQSSGGLEQRTSSRKSIFARKLALPRCLQWPYACGIWPETLCCRLCPSIHA